VGKSTDANTVRTLAQPIACLLGERAIAAGAQKFGGDFPITRPIFAAPGTASRPKHSGWFHF